MTGYIFLGTLVVLTVIHCISDYLYKKNLVNKACDSARNVEFILGNPYVILKEEDYMFMQSRIPFSGVEMPEHPFEYYSEFVRRGGKKHA